MTDRPFYDEIRYPKLNDNGDVRAKATYDKLVQSLRARPANSDLFTALHGCTVVMRLGMDADNPLVERALKQADEALRNAGWPE